WARRQYSGVDWWNPLEPDLIGEQLVADEFTGQPAVLSAALRGDCASDLIRPLEVLGRAAGGHPALAAELGPVLGRELGRLCGLAISQSRGAVDHDLLYGRTVTVAALLEKAVSAIEVDRESVASALRSLPDRFDLVLNSLTLALSFRLVEH